MRRAWVLMVVALCAIQLATPAPAPRTFRMPRRKPVNAFKNTNNPNLKSATNTPAPPALEREQESSSWEASEAEQPPPAAEGRPGSEEVSVPEATATAGPLLTGWACAVKECQLRNPAGCPPPPGRGQVHPTHEMCEELKTALKIPKEDEPIGPTISPRKEKHKIQEWPSNQFQHKVIPGKRNITRYSKTSINRESENTSGEIVCNDPEVILSNIRKLIEQVLDGRVTANMVLKQLRKVISSFFTEKESTS